MEKLIDSLASAVVMADKDNIQELKNISRLFREFAGAANSAGNDFLASLGEKTALFIDKITSSEIKDIENALSIVSSSVRAIQAAFERGEDVCRIMVPPELMACEQSSSSFIENIDKNLLTGFIAETRDRLDSADQHLLAIEEEPQKEDSIHALFRIFHTIKGDAGIISYNEMSVLAHAVEDLLSLARNGELLLSDSALDMIFESVDIIRELSNTLEKALISGREHFRINPSIWEFVSAVKKITRINRPKKIGEIMLESGYVSPEKLARALNEQRKEKIEFKKISQSDPDSSEKRRKTRPAGIKNPNSIIKIDTGRMDELFNAVGELSVIASMLAQDKSILTSASDKTFQNLVFLDKTTREIMEICSSIRMMPIQPVFNKMARLVRDLGIKQEKEIHFKTSGEDTELDRSIVEKIDEPLVHLIRNAIDHGIEKPSERTAASKPASGKIHLSAFYRGGGVCIEIRDDGRGIDRDNILKKASAIGITQTDALLSNEEVYKILFKPGFSTAKEVTDVSGRGVGMDAVKQKIDRLGGNIELSSEKGAGTRVSIRLPLTLATIDGIVVQAGSERYVIPALFIIEVIMDESWQIHMKLGDDMALNYRGSLIPFYSLYRMIGMKCPLIKGYAVIVESGNKLAALHVDKLLGHQHFVVKRLGKILSHAKNISGAVILSDGSVAFVLNIDEIIAKINKEL